MRRACYIATSLLFITYRASEGPIYQPLPGGAIIRLGSNRVGLVFIEEYCRGVQIWSFSSREDDNRRRAHNMRRSPTYRASDL